eukprot:sb/3472034/
MFPDPHPWRNSHIVRHSHLVRSPHMCVGITPGVYGRDNEGTHTPAQTSDTHPTEPEHPDQLPRGSGTVSELLLFNARSLTPSAASDCRWKFSFIKDSLENSPVPILCTGITETWWHDHFSDAQLEIEGFHLTRCDRAGRRGGGCALYINNQLTPSSEFRFSDTIQQIYCWNTS